MYAETGEGEEVEEDSKYSLKEQLVVVISMVTECLLKRKDVLTGESVVPCLPSFFKIPYFSFNKWGNCDNASSFLCTCLIVS